MSINFIITGGALIFAIGIAIGVACGRQSSESLFDRINSSFYDKFNSFEKHCEWKTKNTDDTLYNLSRTITDLDQSNLEKNKNIQLERVIKIITEELNKFK